MSRRIAAPSRGAYRNIQYEYVQGARRTHLYFLLDGRLLPNLGRLLIRSAGTRRLAEERKYITLGEHAANARALDLLGVRNPMLLKEAQDRGKEGFRVSGYVEGMSGGGRVGGVCVFGRCGGGS